MVNPLFVGRGAALKAAGDATRKASLEAGYAVAAGDGSGAATTLSWPEPLQCRRRRDSATSFIDIDTWVLVPR